MGDFSGIVQEGVADVVYTQRSGRPKVEVYTSDNIMPYVKIKVKGGVLYIDLDVSGKSINTGKLKVSVSSETLNRVSFSGAGSLTLSGGLRTPSFELAVKGVGDIKSSGIKSTNVSLKTSGTGNVKLGCVEATSVKVVSTGTCGVTVNDMKTSYVDVKVSGAGSVTLSGTAKKADYAVSGVGAVRASRCRAARVSAKARGTSTVECNATDMLTVDAGRLNTVKYKGSPYLKR